MLTIGSCIGEKPLVCTKEMRQFYLTVNGGTLDTFYTIREVNGDTISSGNNESDGSAYWVLDDRMNETLKGKTENFRFQGIINSEVVVDELFMFRGGPCHLEKVFGKKEVNI
jgi:hypothetical protein